MSDTLLLATRKGLLTFRRDAPGSSGVGWSLAGEAHLGNPVSYALARGDTWFVALDYGHWGQKMSRSRDAGRTWEDIPAPAYPEGAIKYDVWKGTESGATLEYTWVLEAVGNRLYAGTNPGALFTSDDDGDSWQIVEGLWNHPTRPKWMGGGKDSPGIHSIIADPRDPLRMWVALSSAGVFETRDGGVTWATRNVGMRNDYAPEDKFPDVGHDPHFVMPCAAHPDVLWQQNHCGIWRSTDGAATWTDIAETDGPARFGFPIAAHATNPDVAWVVPADSDQKRQAVGGAICVSRTTDGGKTWQAQRNGLPQHAAYDIVYRHALAIRGETLAFASTTGNAYLTEDGGERWETLGQNLPPVYAVRFA
ncbi:MAG: glycosyl hydrolase [Pseudomonadota bacterium]|nr:glycosyl hydrolase [Pseudomonadota bacterium]